MLPPLPHEKGSFCGTCFSTKNQLMSFGLVGACRGLSGLVGACRDLLGVCQELVGTCRDLSGVCWDLSGVVGRNRECGFYGISL